MTWLLRNITDVETGLIERVLGIGARHADVVRHDRHALSAADGERHLRAGGVLASSGRILVEHRSLRRGRVEPCFALFRLES